MYTLPVSLATAVKLIDEYGFTFDETYGCSRVNANMCLVYPRASMLIATSEVHKVVLELEDVLALKVLNVNAWNAYLSKFDN